MTVPNDLSGKCDESNGGSVFRLQRLRGAAIAHSDANVTRTIPIDKGLAIVRAVGEETPVPVYGSLIGGKG